MPASERFSGHLHTYVLHRYPQQEPRLRADDLLDQGDHSLDKRPAVGDLDVGGKVMSELVQNHQLPQRPADPERYRARPSPTQLARSAPAPPRPFADHDRHAARSQLCRTQANANT